MIRFGGSTEDGRKIIGLGLTTANIERVQKGQPIVLLGESVGAPGIVVIVTCAETDEALQAELVEAFEATGGSAREMDELLKHAGAKGKDEP